MFNKVSKVFKRKKSSSKLPKPHLCHGDNQCAGSDGTSANAGETFRQFERVHGSSAVCCVVAAGSSTCLSAANNFELALTQSSSADVVHKWRAHEKDITKVSCGGLDYELCASASRDKSIALWRRGGEESSQTVLQYRYTGHDLVVTGVTLNPSGTQMLSGSRDNSVRLWDLSSSECVRMMALAQNVVTDACWGKTPGSTSAVQSSEDKTVRLWDTRSLRVAVTTGMKQYIQTCCDIASTDDHRCLSSSNGFGGSGCEATLWDLRSSAHPLLEFIGHFETVSGCCFVPLPSQFIAATCSNDGTVRLWDCRTGDMLSAVSIPVSGPLTSISADATGCLYVSSYHAGIQVLSVQQNVNGTFKLSRTAAF